MWRIIHGVFQPSKTKEGLARITLGEAGAEEIFGDDQEKPTFNSRISDWPLSNRETPP